MLFLISCNTAEEVPQKIYNSHSVYETDVSLNDCYLCSSNPDSPMALYWGQANLCILSLNTLTCKALPVNRYDENQNLIATAVRYPSTVTYWGDYDKGSTLHTEVNTNRGYLSLSISLNENSLLKMDNISSHFCSGCLTAFMNEYTYADEKPDIAIVDLEERQIRPVDKTMTYYLLGNYRISSEYNEKSNSIHINAFYCPVRFSELAYDPNETVMEQIINCCAENEIPFVLNNELEEIINSFNQITGIDYSPGNRVEFRNGMKILCIYGDGEYWFLD